MYPGTASFFKTLQQNDKKIAVYSDYRAVDKLRSMGLHADLVVASTDPEIDRLKPDPTALFHIMDKLGVSPEECLFIGDRPELDGECAINANMPYLIVEKEPADQFNFYSQLETQIKTTLNPKMYESNTYAS
jgi:phosphoglycolate phosphatase/putative hydrolase of the HAD superfamily